tara:strand:- start:1126 stop:1587 length:462 start_codon:yes stop_codon:yes gene_type:complete
MVSIVLNVLQRFRQFLLWIWRQNGSPAQRARGIAVGVFCGCFPFFGLQTLLGIMLASLLRGNRLLAVTGTWISNPFTYLPLYWLNYTIGFSILGITDKELIDFRNLTSKELWDQGWLVSSRLLVGSTLVGFVLSMSIGFVFYLCLKLCSKTKV